METAKLKSSIILYTFRAKKSESFYEEREDVHFPNEVLDASTGHSQAEKKRSSGDSGKFFILKVRPLRTGVLTKILLPWPSI